MGVKNMLVLRWSQRAHYWFLGRPKGHIRGPKGHSALWKRPSENAGIDVYEGCSNEEIYSYNSSPNMKVHVLRL